MASLGATAAGPCCKMGTCPAKYSEINKPVKDLLEKDFPFGQVKLEVNTTASNGVKFTMSGTHEDKMPGVKAELKSKYTHKPSRTCFTEKWTSDNVIGTELEMCDSLLDGLKLGFDAQFNAAKNSTLLKVNSGFRRDFLNLNTSVDVFNGPSVSADFVSQFQGFQLGGDFGYDVPSAQVTRYDLAAGYNRFDYSVVVMAKKQLSLFSASVHHKVRSDLSTGAMVTYDHALKTPVSFEFVSQYALDKDAYVKSKVDSQGKLGMSYTQTLRPALKLTVGCLVDTKNLNQNTHKLGLAMVFDS